MSEMTLWYPHELGPADLDHAIELAVTAHNGQRDKQGEAYIRHSLRVMEAVAEEGYPAMIAGVLHDCVEDTWVTLAGIGDGFGPEVRDAVDAVTRRKDEPYGTFIVRAKANPLGAAVKMADVADNRARIPDQDTEIGAEPQWRRFERKYSLATCILLDLGNWNLARAALDAEFS